MRTKKTGKRLLSWVIALAMVVGLVPGMSLTAYAADPVTYLDENGDEQVTADYTVVSPSTPFDKDGFYVVNGKIDFVEPLYIETNVSLILCNGATLTVNPSFGGGIYTNKTLKVYAQSKEINTMGKLSINSPENTGIYSEGHLTINGGNVTAKGQYAGIFSSGILTVNGGSLNASSSAETGSGISSYYQDGAGVIIKGGTVTASGGAGVDAFGGVTISGGTVSATGTIGPGIAAPSVTINGGSVTASSTNYAAFYAENMTLGEGVKVFAGDNADSATDVTSTFQDTHDQKWVHAEKPSHTHNFEYSLNQAGDTITASCGNTGCTLTSAPTLTIVAPTLTTYGETGKSASATLNGLEAFKAATSLNVAATDIKYVGRDGTTYEESATAPTDAGKYTAKMTVEGKTATVDYEIAKAATSVTTAPTAGEITYGKTLADSTLTGGVASVAGTFAWKDSTKAPAVSDSDIAEYDVVFTPTSANYGTVECKVKLTVNKADPVYVTPTGLSAFVGQTLADVALPTADNGTWSWVEDTTTPLNKLGMTEHVAKFTPNDTNNYNTLENVSLQIEVSEKPLAVPAAVTANSRTYDGTEKPLVNVDDSTLAGGEMQYALGTDDKTAPTEGWGKDIPSKTDAGTYYVWYKVVGDANHNDSNAASIPVTINKADPTVTAPTAKTLTYTGKAQALVEAGKAEGGTMQYSLDGKTYAEKLPEGTDAGKYSVYYKVVGDKNHNDTEAKTVEATIAEAKPEQKPEEKPEEKTDAVVTTAPKAKNLTYNGKAQALVNAGKAKGGAMQYALGNKTKATGSYSDSIPTGTKAGTYYVWYKVVGDENHNDSKAACVKVTIAEAQKEQKPFTDFRTLRLVAKRGTKSVNLTWRMYDDADGYLIYGCECGEGSKMKLLKTIKGNKTVKWTHKNLKKATYYKYKVVAYKNVKGKKKTLVTSKEAHTVTHDGKTTAVKAVKVNKTSVSLKKDETFQIKASEVKENKNKKIDHHREISYESSNKKVATVNKNGRVKGVKKGEATIFVYSETGSYKTVKVTVK